MEIIDEILSDAARAGAPLLSNAAELEALIKRSNPAFLVQPSILGYEVGAANEVKGHLGTPPGDAKALWYQNLGDGQFQISIGAPSYWK